MASSATPFPDDSPPAPPAAERRAAAGALEEALAACAALAPRLAAVPPLAGADADADARAGADAATATATATAAAAADGQRRALLALAPALQAARVAVARLAAAADEPARAEGGGDALTGLADRAELAAAGVALARQYPDTPLMVLAADVDHLRHVNDAWSHATGDAVLQAVAGVLRAQSRPQDVLARADGNLFVVALGGPVSTTRALLVAERLRAAIEAHGWDEVGAGLRVTASIGVAARAPGESLDDVLARAGAALQECKRGGRNQVRARG